MINKSMVNQVRYVSVPWILISNSLLFYKVKSMSDVTVT
jgi:hypothetical protein